jgi:hypothetical protein
MAASGVISKSSALGGNQARWEVGTASSATGPVAALACEVTDSFGAMMNLSFIDNDVG